MRTSHMIVMTSSNSNWHCEVNILVKLMKEYQFDVFEEEDFGRIPRKKPFQEKLSQKTFKRNKNK